MKLMLEISGDEDEVLKFQQVVYALSEAKVFEWVKVDDIGYMEEE